MIDPAEERFMAGRAGGTMTEFPTASYISGTTMYATQFAQLIERAVQATAENKQ